MNYIKALALGLFVAVNEFAGYMLAGIALTLGYYYGVDLNAWLSNIS